MKFKSRVVLISFLFLFSSSQAQEPAGHAIAINESQLSYLEPESCNFSEKFGFDMRFNTFKEVTYKTYLFSAPGLDMKDLIKPIPRGTIVKAYKHFKVSGSWAIKYDNDWGFVSEELLNKIEKYEEPLEDDDLDSPPQLLSKLSIRYPSKAKKEGIKGEVVLRIMVSNTGAVTKVEVEKSVPQLDSAAIHAVQKLRFKPAKKYGSPTDVWVRIPLKFEISGS